MKTVSEASLWTHPGNKFTIGTLHGKLIEIEAQYNPKEVARQATASWNSHVTPPSSNAKGGDSYRFLEYGNTEPRTLTVELLFDGYEQSLSIAPLVEQLENLTIPVDMRSSRASERRPQICVAVWGTQSLRCVVQSVSTKLTMFSATGEPLRATCTVTFKEADAVAMLRADRDRTDVDARSERIAREHTRWSPDPPQRRANPRDAKLDFNDLE
ncbi:MAG: hypothetical protein QM831_43935 [Kofleriaceae bacterium]